jgi:hypothetical protein
MKGASIMEGEPLELDFDTLNRAINEAAECKVGGCSCRVPEPDSLCIVHDQETFWVMDREAL